MRLTLVLIQAIALLLLAVGIVGLLYSQTPNLVGPLAPTIKPTVADGQVLRRADVVSRASQCPPLLGDPQRIRKTDPGRPDYCNVHAYYRVFAPEIATEVDEGCRAAAFGCTDCKARLGEILVEYLAPIREKREALLADEGKVESILRQGMEKAKAVASSTMAEVWEASHFLRLE